MMSIFCEGIHEYSTEAGEAGQMSLAGDQTFTTGPIAVGGMDSR